MKMMKILLIIETFLEARKVDGASFDWSPPDESTNF